MTETRIYRVTEVETSTKAYIYEVEAVDEEEAYEIVSQGEGGAAYEEHDPEPYEWEITDIEDVTEEGCNCEG